MDALEDLEAVAFAGTCEEPSFAPSEGSPGEASSPVRTAEFSEPFTDLVAARAASSEYVPEIPTPATKLPAVLSPSEYAEALASAVDRCSKKPKLSLPWESKTKMCGAVMSCVSLRALVAACLFMHL